MGARVLTGTALALAVAACLGLDALFPDGLVPWAVASLLGLLAVRELSRMGDLAPYRLGPPLFLAAVLASALWLGFVLDPGLVGASTGPGRLMGLTYLAPLLLVVLVAALSPGGTGRIHWAVFGCVWILPPLFGLILVDARWGVAGLGVLVALSKVGDVFGYFVGRRIGRSHPFPRLSPGKTTAGCVASAVAGTVLGASLGAAGWLFDAGLGVLAGAGIGLALNLSAQAGDLLESRVKRRARVKDSSAWLGPAGGVLDVVDSLLLSVPVALTIVPWLLADLPGV